MSPKTTKKDHSWVKQLYYYLVLAFSILFLAIGSYMFLRANLVKFVFPEAGNNYYYSERVVCEPKIDENGEQISENCVTKENPNREDEENREYQRDMVNSTLMIIVSSIVLGLHLKFMGPEMKKL